MNLTSVWQTCQPVVLNLVTGLACGLGVPIALLAWLLLATDSARQAMALGQHPLAQLLALVLLCLGGSRCHRQYPTWSGLGWLGITLSFTLWLLGRDIQVALNF